MTTLPVSRTSEIVVQELKGELLVYDLATDRALCLNQTATIVYQSCDGRTTLAELKSKHGLTDELIYLALDELKKNDLLIQEANYFLPFAEMSRREVIKQAGLASVIALPVITGITAPAAAYAASNTCIRNICIAAGQDVCAGCPAGTQLGVGIYVNSTNGTCSGALAAGPVICDGTPRTFAFDAVRT